jgi:hypothetical protein
MLAMNIDLIYLNKGENENDTSGWVYYRVTSVEGLGSDAGQEGSTVRVCRVKWPKFEDSGNIIDTPGTVTKNSAHRNTVNLVGQWGIDHDQSILIGVLETG